MVSMSRWGVHLWKEDWGSFHGGKETLALVAGLVLTRNAGLHSTPQCVFNTLYQTSKYPDIYGASTDSESDYTNAELLVALRYAPACYCHNGMPANTSPCL